MASHEASALTDAAEFSFRHATNRDVAYESMPKLERAAMHLAIANWFKRSLPDRIDEFTELVASHLVASLGYQEELRLDTAGRLRDLRELTYAAALRAARKAWSLDLVSRACGWMRQAIDLAVVLERTPREIARLVGEDIHGHGSLGGLPDHVPVLSVAAERLAAVPDELDEDKQLLARLRSALGQALVGAGEVEEARASLRQGIADLEPGPATPGRARLRRTLGWTYWQWGPVDEAASLVEAAVAEARACGDDETLRWAIHDLGITRDRAGGSLDEALEYMEQSFGLAKAAGDRVLLQRCYNNLPWVRLDRGDLLEPVVAMAKEGLRMARHAAEGASDAPLAYTVGWCSLELGRLDEGTSYLDESIAAARSRGLNQRVLLCGRAIILRHRGDLDALLIGMKPSSMSSGARTSLRAPLPST